MENKKKLTIIASGVIAMILLAVTLAYLFLGGGFLKKTGAVSKEADGLGFNAASLQEVNLTFAIPGFKPAKLDEIISELQKKAIKELNVKLNLQWDNRSHVETHELIKDWNDSESQFDAYCLLDYIDIGPAIKKSLKEGLISDISELFPKYAPKYYKKFTENDLSPAVFEGKLGVIPYYMPVLDRRYAMVRADLMKKYNIPEINSYNDFEFFLKTVRQNETGIKPLFLNTMNDSFAPYNYDTTLKLFAESYGYVIFDFGLGIVYKWDDPDMKLMAWEQTPEYKEAALRLKRWRDSGYCDMDGNYFNPNDYASLITNKSDMFFVGRDADYGRALDTRCKLYQLYPDKISQRRYLFYTGIAVSSKSKNPERVLMFIEWLQSNRENYDLLMYGIKGKNYVLYGDQLGFVKDGDSDDKLYMTWSGYQAFLNLDNERSNMMLSPDFKTSYIDDVQKKSKFAPHSGFVLDLEPVKIIAINRTSGYCTIEEAIKTETFTVKTIDDFISEQKKKDVDKLLSSLQKQLDDWKAAKKK